MPHSQDLEMWETDVWEVIDRGLVSLSKTKLGLKQADMSVS